MTTAIPPPENAWFCREVKYWWIMNVFWPEHLKRHGYVNTVLITKNISTHDTKYNKGQTLVVVSQDVKLH